MWLATILALAAALETQPAAAAPARELSVAERLQCQRAIEEVYWRHRIWPEENRRPKPALAAVMPRAAIVSKVQDAVAMSAALAELYHAPIAAADLQAELDRMAKGSRNPRLLAELFGALGSDPALAAECLARPVLAERRLRIAYAFDSREHGAVAERARAEVAAARNLDDLRQSSGEVSEAVFRREGEPAPPRFDRPGPDHSAVDLSPTEWEAMIDLLAGELMDEAQSVVDPGDGLAHASGTPPAADNLPVGRLGALREEADRFIVRTVTGTSRDRLEIVTVTWPKRTFDSWWSARRETLAGASIPTSAVAATYGLPSLAESGSCTDDTWQLQLGSIPVPSPRSRHTAVWTGTEMVIWGGAASGSASLDTGGRYDPATDSWTATSLVSAPSPRTDHTAVWTGSEMVVWGGYTRPNGVLSGGTPPLDTGGRYNALTDTWTPTSSTSAPSARGLHTAVWTGTVMVVWGGGGDTYLDTGGRYDPANDTWLPTSLDSAPSARIFHTAVWTGSQMVIWGGFDEIVYRLDTGGRYDPTTDTWSATSQDAAPTARDLHSAVWTGTAMVVWGGSDIYGNTSTGGRYVPSTDTWSPTSLASAPSGRYGQTAVWTGTRMVVWGGHGDYVTVDTGGRYDPVLDTWSATSATSAPAPRYQHSAVWTGTQMVVWGGSYLNTGGRYDPSDDSWVATASPDSPAPIGRAQHTAVWTGTEMVVWGGTRGANSGLDTGSRYDPALDTWTATSLGSVPTGRYEHTAVWTGTDMVVWGGYLGGVGYLDSGGRYSPSSDTWAPTSLESAPSARYAHTAVWTGSKMLVWGGWGGSYTNTGGRYDPTNDTWAPTSLDTAPTGRYENSAVWTGTEMIVWGGYPAAAFQTGGRYNPATDVWTPTLLAPALSGRYRHSGVWTGREMLVWGGEASVSCLDTGLRYDPSADSWAPMSTTSAPTGRCFHRALWLGREMVVWGGWTASGGSILDSGGRYNPSTDTWTATSLDAPPSPRYWHSAVWTGSEMVVWGGWGVGGYLDTGGRYCAIASLDTVAPTNPDPVAAEAPHVEGGWSSQTTLTMDWSGATDELGGSGLAGYSVLFDTSATSDPGASVDIAHGTDPHTTSTSPLAEGQHYFHLRACDFSGNCAATLNRGPYGVDATAPGTVGSLASPSHAVGVPTLANAIDVTWTAAADNLAGIDGYAYAFTGGSSAVCDQGKDLEETATAVTSATLPAGSWYVHLCARDNAGNWGDAATAGPFVVDFSLLHDDFETAQLAGWSDTDP